MKEAIRIGSVDLADVAASAAVRYELDHKLHNHNQKLSDSRRASLSTHNLSSCNSVNINSRTRNSNSNNNIYCESFNEKRAKSPSIHPCASMEKSVLEEEQRCASIRSRATSTAQDTHLHGAAVEIEGTDRPWRLRRAVLSSCSATKQHVYPYVVQKATRSNSTLKRCNRHDCNAWKELPAGAQRNRLRMMYGSGRPW